MSSFNIPSINTTTIGITDPGFVIVANVDKLWGELPLKLRYVFLDGGEFQRRKVREACKEWERWADVEFIEVANKDDAQIRIGFKNNGNWSWIGNDCLKEFAQKWEQTMNFGDVNDVASFSTHERGTILREFGHALGIKHEHKLPARDGEGKLPYEDAALLSELDTKSIMAFPVPAQLAQSGEPDMSQDMLSEMDKAYITITYPRRDNRYADKDWSLHRALEIAKVPANVSIAILERASVGDVRAVCKAFSEWSMDKFRAVYAYGEEARVPITGNPEHFGSEKVNAVTDAMQSIDWLGLLTGSAQYATTATPGETTSFATTASAPNGDQLASILSLLQPAAIPNYTEPTAVNEPPTAAPQYAAAQPAFGQAASYTSPSGPVFGDVSGAAQFSNTVRTVLDEVLSTIQPSPGLPGVKAAEGHTGRGDLHNTVVENVKSAILGQIQPGHAFSTTGQGYSSAGPTDILRQQMVSHVSDAMLRQMFSPVQLSPVYPSALWSMPRTNFVDVASNMVINDILTAILKELLVALWQPPTVAPVPSEVPHPTTLLPIVVPVLQVVLDPIPTPAPEPREPSPIPDSPVPVEPEVVAAPVEVEVESAPADSPVHSPTTVASEISEQEVVVPEEPIKFEPEIIPVSLPTPTLSMSSLDISADEVVVEEEVEWPVSPPVEPTPLSDNCCCCPYHLQNAHQEPAVPAVAHKSKPSEDKISLSMLTSLVTRHEWACNGCMDVPSNDLYSDVHGVDNTVAANMDRLWSEFPLKLRYTFLEGADIQRRKVRDTCKEWERWADVEFIEVSNKDEAQIRIGFQNDANWSWIGNDCLKEPAHQREQTMNLGDVHNAHCFGEQERGNILHEFGHVLGMTHEHQSSSQDDEDDFLDENATLAYYMGGQYKFPANWVRERVIDFYNNTDMSNFPELDDKSIMMSRFPSQVTKSGSESLQNNKLSDMDKAYVTIVYPRRDDRYTDKKWSLQRALDIFKVPANVAGIILNHATAGNVQEVRKAFLEWSANKDKVVVAENEVVCEAAPECEYVPEDQACFGDGHAEVIPDATQLDQQPELDDAAALFRQVASGELEDTAIDFAISDDPQPELTETVHMEPFQPTDDVNYEAEETFAPALDLFDAPRSPIDAVVAECDISESAHTSPATSVARLEPSTDTCDIVRSPTDEEPVIVISPPVQPMVQAQGDVLALDQSTPSTGVDVVLPQQEPNATMSALREVLDPVQPSHDLPSTPVELPNCDADTADSAHGPPLADIFDVVLQQLRGTTQPPQRLAPAHVGTPSTGLTNIALSPVVSTISHPIIQQALAAAQATRGAPTAAGVPQPLASRGLARVPFNQPSTSMPSAHPLLKDMPVPIAQAVVNEIMSTRAARGVPAASPVTTAEVEIALKTSTSGATSVPPSVRVPIPSALAERIFASRVSPGIQQNAATQAVHGVNKGNTFKVLGNPVTISNGTGASGEWYGNLPGAPARPPMLSATQDFPGYRITHGLPPTPISPDGREKAPKANFAPQVITTIA